MKLFKFNGNSKHWKGNFKTLIRQKIPWLPLSIHKILKVAASVISDSFPNPKEDFILVAAHLSCPQKELCKNIQKRQQLPGFQERSKHSFIQQNKVKPHTPGFSLQVKRGIKAETSNVSVHFSSSLFLKLGAGAPSSAHSVVWALWGFFSLPTDCLPNEKLAFAPAALWESWL